MLSKEMLNKNRVLTMSTNRVCDELVVNCGIKSTIMMAIRKGDTKDILFIKEFKDANLNEITNNAIWICREFNIHKILLDKFGTGQNFYYEFLTKISDTDIKIWKINGLEFNRDGITDALREAEKDAEYGSLRLLQTPECACYSYRKTFLGYNEIMNSHAETDKLLSEVENISFIGNTMGKYALNIKNKEIGKLRLECLLLSYSSPIFRE